MRAENNIRDVLISATVIDKFRECMLNNEISSTIKLTLITVIYNGENRNHNSWIINLDLMYNEGLPRQSF